MSDSPQAQKSVLRRQVLGRLLAAVRNQQGLTQVEIAGRAQLTQATVDRVERGLTALTVETLLDLAGVLGTTGPSLVCLLDALIDHLDADGYQVVCSPPRGGRAGVTLPVSDLDGRVLAAYVGGWLESNRDLPEVTVSRAVDSWPIPAPVPTPNNSAYATVRAMAVLR
jgi:transcriptional regulator with XRE-family HTH domain